MAHRRSSPPPARGAAVHRVTVVLRGSTPAIWRRLDVASDTSLAGLHRILQCGFGWDSSHLWMFQTPRGEYGSPGPGRGSGHRNAAVTTLQDVAPEVGDRFCYIYDFGDDWEHDIEVEAVTPAEPGVVYPRCVAGRRAGPPEDCGGVGGYEDLVAVLTDPGHEEHEERLEWLGLDSADHFDPAAFDVTAVNRHLALLTAAVGGTARS